MPRKSKIQTPSETKEAIPAWPTTGAYPDALQGYLDGVRRYPVLTQADEHTLGLRAAKGDAEARRLLVLHNLRLALKIVHVYVRATSLRFEDLVQEANTGLIAAAAHFDPTRGARFTTCAGFWIRAYILRFLLENHSPVKIGTTQVQRKIFFNLHKVVAQMSRGGRDVSDAELGKYFGLDEQKMTALRVLISNRAVSFDAPVHADEDSSTVIGDYLTAGLGSEPARPDAVLEAREAAYCVQKAFAGFRAGLVDERDQAIFDRWRTGLTLQDVGAQFGVTRERIRQVEVKLLNRFAAYLRLYGISGLAALPDGWADYLPAATRPKQTKRTAALRSTVEAAA